MAPSVLKGNEPGKIEKEVLQLPDSGELAYLMFSAPFTT